MCIASRPAQDRTDLSNLIVGRCAELLHFTKNHGTSLATSTDEIVDIVRNEIVAIRKLLHSERERAVKEGEKSRQTLACKFQESISLAGLAQQSVHLRLKKSPETPNLACYGGIKTGFIRKPEHGHVKGQKRRSVHH